MKEIFIILFTIFSISIHSQVDRRVGQDIYKRNHKIKSTEEINEITLKKLADELNLDGFQQAVVKNLITDFSKSAKEINDATTLSPLEKSEKIGKESEKFKTKLFEILNEEQKEKHNKLTNTKDKKKK